MAGEASGIHTDPLVVDVWSDVMCPFCYMGDALLMQAIDRFEHKQSVEIRYHSYQLMPQLPADAIDLNELLVRERGFPREQAEAMNAQVAARGAQLGLEYRFDRAIATNTYTAHRLMHFAADKGRQHEMVQQLFRAYFTDGHHVGDHDVLAELAAEVGLDRNEALEALRSGAFADEVDADIALAQQMGISGVPFFVFAGQYAVSGAQPVEGFLQALNTAWAALTTPAGAQAKG
ncbi:DsbA family protein [Nocardia sp. 2YAB30]|uniref:DsbA family oxidoreductase n=1 Tax=unclassified Nocardia TaxID=2637762 RepID=UPI003F9601F7